MLHYWYFWKPAPYLCKESGVYTHYALGLIPLLYHSILLIYPPPLLPPFFLKSAIPLGKLQELISYLKLTIPELTTKGKIRLYLHDRAQLLAIYCSR